MRASPAPDSALRFDLLTPGSLRRSIPEWMRCHIKRHGLCLCTSRLWVNDCPIALVHNCPQRSFSTRLAPASRYAEAATLRDEAATSVLGWFVGRGEDDPHGHLLRVSTAYNRYMGHAFSARDISAAKVAIVASCRASGKLSCDATSI